MSAAEKAKSERPSHRSRTVAFASAIVIAILLAYLTREAFRDGSPPVIAFEVMPEEGWTEGSAAYVPIEVRNTGGRTAAAIEVETRFEVPGAEPIIKRTIVDFLAGGEVNRIYAVGPAGTIPNARLIGFREP